MDWGNLISQYAFPIVGCMAMAWYVYDRGEKERADRKESENKHKEEVDRLSGVIGNNTIVMEKNTVVMDKIFEILKGGNIENHN